MDLATLTLREIAEDTTARRETDTVPYRTGSAGSSSSTLRRCRTREQGVALITMGHAIEYLFQSRLLQQPATTGAEREALAILLNANLSVYNEGAEIVPVMNRLRRWFHGGNHLKTAAAR